MAFYENCGKKINEGERIANVTQTGWVSKSKQIIICKIVLLLVFLLIIGACKGTKNSGVKTLDENSKTIIMGTQGLFLRLSSNTSIDVINKFPDLIVYVEDNEEVKQDWEIIKNAYKIKNKVQVEDAETIGMRIALSYGQPQYIAVFVVSNEDFEYYSRLKQSWLYLLEDSKKIIPEQENVNTMLMMRF